ncbi:MAG: MFS transporter [Dehalococcoidia bacterium]
MIEKKSLFLGWWVVFGSFLSNAMYSVTGLVAIGLFIEPMSSSLNWSVASISVGIALRQIAGTIVGPLLGPRVDKTEPKKLFFISTFITGISTIVLGFITNVWVFYMVYGVIGAIAITGISNLVTGTVISKWFIKSRGRALGFSDLGSSVGVIILIPVINIIITSHSWELAWISLGLLHLIIMTPVAFLMKRQPEDYGLLPDNEISVEHDLITNDSKSDTVVWTAKEAIKTYQFWIIILAFGLSNISVMAILTHQINHIVHQGFSSTQAALIISLWAIFAGFARVLFGFLLERISVRYLSFIVMIGSALGTYFLLIGNSLELLYCFAIIYGLFRGAIVLMSIIIWADYYGRTNLGAIRGLTTPFNIISLSIGPVAAGYFYDQLGSYDMIFSVFILLYVISGVLILFTHSPKKK